MADVEMTTEEIIGLETAKIAQMELKDGTIVMIKNEEEAQPQEEFVQEEAQEVHGDKYDYSKTEYVNGDSKICIICPQHGEFWQTPQKHLHGQNCPQCTASKPIDFQTFKKQIFQQI